MADSNYEVVTHNNQDIVLETAGTYCPKNIYVKSNLVDVDNVETLATYLGNTANVNILYRYTGATQTYNGYDYIQYDLYVAEEV